MGITSKYAVFHHIMHKIGPVLVENNLYGEYVEEISAIVENFRVLTYKDAPINTTYLTNYYNKTIFLCSPKLIHTLHYDISIIRFDSNIKSNWKSL